MIRIGNVYMDVNLIECVYYDKATDEIKVYIRNRIEPLVALKNHSSSYYNLDNLVEKITKAKCGFSKDDYLDEELDIAMDEWEVPVRTQNCLKYLFNEEGIKTIGDLVNCGQKKLLSYPNLGRKTFNELKFILMEKYGLRFEL